MAARDYGQYDGVTRALELVGERWGLLIVRDLLVGPRRYGELAEGLPRIPTNILAARLKELQAAGIIRRLPRSRDVLRPRDLVDPEGGEVRSLELDVKERHTSLEEVRHRGDESEFRGVRPTVELALGGEEGAEKDPVEAADELASLADLVGEGRPASRELFVGLDHLLGHPGALPSIPGRAHHLLDRSRGQLGGARRAGPGEVGVPASAQRIPRPFPGDLRTSARLRVEDRQQPGDPAHLVRDVYRLALAGSVR